MLQCTTCQAALAIMIHPKLTQPSSVQKVVLAYETKLATAHKPSCPFRLDAELYLVRHNKEKQAAVENKSTVEEEDDDDDDGDASEEEKENPEKEANTTHSNIIPTHLASVLPRDFWDLVEHPSPLSLLQDRFQTLCKYILNGEEPEVGAPPKWQLPDISLPDDVLGFGVVDPSKEQDDGDHHPSPSKKQSRVLARLAFDPSKPYTAIGWEKQTLLTTLEEILRPHSQEDEIRAQTRAQGAWEALYEGMAALALFGWLPREEQRDSSSDKQEEASVTLRCSVCLSFLNFSLEKYDWHHHSHGRKATFGDGKGEEGDRPTKRRRLDSTDNNSNSKLNPLLAHRCFCPYACGFPQHGERRGTPVWQNIVAKLIGNHKKSKSDQEDDQEDESNAAIKNKMDEEDSAVDRILQLLQSSVSSGGVRASSYS